MNDEVSYSYGILRYFHDIATGECVNVGVALYSQHQNFLGMVCIHSAERAALLWPEMDREAFTRAMMSLERSFSLLANQISKSPVPTDLTISDLVKRVLPVDDSSLKWGSFGSGLSNDLNRELGRLFGRMVRRYEAVPAAVYYSYPFTGGSLLSNQVPDSAGMSVLGVPTARRYEWYSGSAGPTMERFLGRSDLPQYFDPWAQSNAFVSSGPVGVAISQYPHAAPTMTVSTTAPTKPFETEFPGRPYFSSDNTISIITTPVKVANK